MGWHVAVVLFLKLDIAFWVNSVNEQVKSNGDQRRLPLKCGK